MKYQTLKEIILNRRSVRKFTEQAVSLEQVREIIDCARHAPSDTNSQTWEFIVIMNQDKIQEIAQLTWDELYKREEEAKQKGLAREGRLLVKSFGTYATAFANAPALIICLATPYASKFRDKIFDPIGMVEEAVWQEEGIKSSCLATQNLMLAAHALGLATCPMTGPVLLAQERLAEYLQIPSNKQINMVIALGHPAETPSKPVRKDIEEILQIIE